MSKLRISLALAALCSATAINANTQAKFMSEDIFSLEYVNDPQISPDGSKVIYLRASYDIMSDKSKRSLWLYDVKKDAHVPLFADEHSYSSARWSNDGSRIAFVSDRSGSSQLHMLWLEQNKSALLTQLPKSISNLTWSPDGTQLAFTMNVPEGKSDYVKSVKMPSKPKGATWSEPVKVIEKARYQADGRGFLEPSFSHIFVVPADGGAARALTHGEYQHTGPLSWSPDSQAVVFSSDQHPQWEYRTTEADLFTVNLKTGEQTQLTQLPGREYKATFSKDGESLAFISRGNEPVPYVNSQLTLLDLNSGNTKVIGANLDRSISDYAWTGKGDFVVQYDDFGRRKLATMTHKGKVSELSDALSGTTLGRPYISGQFTMAKSGAIAYTHGSSERPAELAMLNKGKSRVVSAINEDILGHKTLGEVHEFTVKSQFDGQSIQGWYITPPDFDDNKKYPLIVEIHGGPHLAYGPHFTAELQRYAAQGYVVMYMNYRGSTSYGTDFALLLDGKYSSEEDFADHNSGVDALIEKGFIDSNNLFIAGGSAGGIATAYAIGLTDRFNAAAITKPVINWLSKVLTADSYLGQIRNQFPGKPWEHLDHYWKRSPLSLVGNVTTPAMIMTGEQDRRTPISESEQFYQALKLQQVDTVLIRVPGSPHGIAGRPSRMIAKIEHTLAWFERYKK
ncbi:S9 family peptidase [Pseudoalteromonas sp. SSDWG2]|uniref:S9 family peptidase n=1 Tax=Pseudoalteromonas sp. SSDWG2 TaxID=3139391 RepID=UPI003BABE4F2